MERVDNSSLSSIIRSPGGVSPLRCDRCKVLPRGVCWPRERGEAVKQFSLPILLLTALALAAFPASNQPQAEASPGATITVDSTSDPAGGTVACGDAYVTEDAQYVYIGNQQLEIVFQRSDGELYAIKNKSTNTDFMHEKNAWWSLYDFLYYKDDQPKYVGGWLSQSFSYSSRTVADGVALDLYWNAFTVDGGSLDVQVGVTVEVKDSSPLSYWTIAITNNESITIEAVYFPTISGLGQISADPEQDYLVYPSMSGMLFQNPLGNFAQGRGWGWQMYYPSAYSTMQFMAYYGPDPAAGLYLASYDQSGNSKFFDFSKPSPSWAVAQMAHIPEFVAGADYQMTYPAVVGVFSGDWYEAAQLYRTWALGQPWTSQGPLATRSDVPDWYGSAGLRLWITTHPNCVSNSNPFSIIPEVVGDTGSYIGHPAIAGWMGWEHVGWYVEYPDVFPPKEGWDAFRQAITDTHASGNRVLFLPDTTSYSSAAPSWSSAEPYACRDRSGNYSNSFSFSECGMTATFHSMCPATSYWQNTLQSMLSTLAQEDADVIQLDGFPVLGPQPCVDAGHGHPNGGGTWWHDSYEGIFSDFKTTARQTNPDLVLTSEGMAESYMPLLDSFWDPFTTGWSPNSLGDSFAHPLEAQLIPLWHAVYHDYAYLESGVSFFSRNAPSGAEGYGNYRDYYVRGFALSLVWGEMPVTWYADEKMSQLNEQQEVELAGYLKRIVEARTGYAQPYLVYGRMLRPPALNVPDFYINGAKRIPYTLDDYPPFDSPAVLGTTWKASSGDVGYIFTNISYDPVTFTLTVSPSDILLPPEDTYDVIQNRNGLQSTLLTGAHLPQTLTLQIQPLDVLLIKVAPSTPVGGIAELPAMAQSSNDNSGSPAGTSGLSASAYAVLAGGVAGALAALTAGAWYAKRRWLG